MSARRYAIIKFVYVVTDGACCINKDKKQKQIENGISFHSSHLLISFSSMKNENLQTMYHNTK